MILIGEWNNQSSFYKSYSDSHMDLGKPDTRDKEIIYKLTEIVQATDNEKMYTKDGNKIFERYLETESVELPESGMWVDMNMESRYAFRCLACLSGRCWWFRKHKENGIEHVPSFC